MIIQAVEAEGRSVGRNFPAIEFAGKKSPDLIFSNVDRYGGIYLFIIYWQFSSPTWSGCIRNNVWNNNNNDIQRLHTQINLFNST